MAFQRFVPLSSLDAGDYFSFSPDDPTTYIVSANVPDIPQTGYHTLSCIPVNRGNLIPVLIYEDEFATTMQVWERGTYPEFLVVE